jgi:hypothetical protein
MSFLHALRSIVSALHGSSCLGLVLLQLGVTVPGFCCCNTLQLQEHADMWQVCSDRMLCRWLGMVKAASSVWPTLGHGITTLT